LGQSPTSGEHGQIDFNAHLFLCFRVRRGIFLHVAMKIDGLS